MLVFLNDIHAIGLQTAQGLVVTTAFYWDMNDETRAWNERFQERHGRPASYIQAGPYSAVAHYLKAIDAAGTDEAKAVSAKMKEMPVNALMTDNATVRAAGSVLRAMYLVELQQPQEPRELWGYNQCLAQNTR